VAAQDKVPRAPPDDLKRIRGIGVLIEKRLLAMGITSYEEVANWTAADIDRVSQSLEFKGRIERENWVEQARILASGGVTEFSRRFDRGETDAGRAGP
jgi:predicted flap endonuclease-1-like 5' DNA nuclease